jgi:hypothetical protein
MTLPRTCSLLLATPCSFFVATTVMAPTLTSQSALAHGTGDDHWVYGDEAVDSRYARLNAQVIEIDRSPVSSLFGFYVGGQKGTTVSSALAFVS